MKGIIFLEQNLKVDETSYKNMKGIKLYKEHDEKELYFKNQSEFQNLYKFLKKRVFQTNFHSYYKAIKKLGRGNFATVFTLKNKNLKNI